MRPRGLAHGRAELLKGPTRHTPPCSRPAQRVRAALRRCAARRRAPGMALPGAWDAWLSGTLSELSRRQLLRSLRPVVPTDSPVVVVVPAQTMTEWLAGTLSTGGCAVQPGDPPPADGARVRLFSANDYLGLSAHPAVRAAAARAAAERGCGPRASALVAGYTHEHAALERDLAELKGTEDALLFPSGFAANASVVAALAGDSSCAIFSDALNHASLVDGCRLAAARGATVHVYRHCDAAHAAALLAASTAPRKLLLTDTLFSMDGDFAPLAALAAACSRHGAALAVDDAHATLVCGSRGQGALPAGVSCDVHIGTLSKAVGAQGGFVACSRAMKQLLISTARGQVYSTALPLPVVAAASAALTAAREEPWRREALWERVQQLSDLTGLRCGSPIVSLHVGGEAEALAASAALLAQGFHVPAIRPPTVPPGTCRLRVALSAAHSRGDVEELAAALRRCGVLDAALAQQRRAAALAPMPQHASRL